MTARVLVTGASGFIGGAVARACAARGRAVLSLDRVRSLDDDLAQVNVDLRDRAAVEGAVARFAPDAIVHAAARLPVAGDARDVVASNVDGTRHVLDAAARAGVGRVVFLSTTTVYALDGAPWRGEDSPLDPVSPYGRSKRAAEALCERARAEGASVSMMRLVPVIGPGRSGLFHHLFEWVRDGRRVPLLGDGRNRVQLVHVDDCCEAVEALLTAPRAEGAFNVGAPRVASVGEEVGALCDAAGTGARPVTVPAWLAERPLAALHALRLTPTHPWMIYAASREMTFATDRLRALGWAPRFSGAEALVDSYRAHLAALGAPDDAHADGHRAPWRSTLLDALRRLG